MAFSNKVEQPVAFYWLITVRWTTVLAGLGAVLAGRSALEIPIPVAASAAAFPFWVISNVWLVVHVRQAGDASLNTLAGAFVSIDVALLTWLLLQSGGVLNPASVVYLVEIVLAALVLGRQWTWIITTLCITGYASLYLAPTSELRAAQSMHHEIALHMRGMWLAFALTALIIAILVTRLSIAVERRDHALDELRDRTNRATRAAGLATLAAGAAHELSTPLSTIAVAAHELERNFDAGAGLAELRDDVRLIRAEAARCRKVLDDMAAHSGEPAGETPRSVRVADVVATMRTQLNAGEAARLDLNVPEALQVVWPMTVTARALANLVRNALQASSGGARVVISAQIAGDRLVRLAVTDQGAGMSQELLNRVGEPFFTTKAAGAGTGLGVFVARSSIEQLGGQLAFESATGRGTTATIILPVNVVSALISGDPMPPAST